jgi:hypothetical protein
MSSANVRLPQLPQPRPFMATSRPDRWWLTPLLTFLGLSAFIVYSTWAAFQGNHFFFDANGAHYLSPMYSPVLWDPPGITSGHAWFGQAPQWLLALFPSFVGFSPAFLILWAPAGFRFTCYYYRGAYYKAFWMDPVNCAVGEPRKGYIGERALPLILQNVHRYFFYIAAAFIGLLTYDAIISYWFTDPATGESGLGLAVGSLVLTINPILLGGYTFGCHSFRHLVGGKKDCVGSDPARKHVYAGVSCLNRGHMKWAWASLFWVGFTDFYVRMCSMGVWTDWRIL